MTDLPTRPIGRVPLKGVARFAGKIRAPMPRRTPDGDFDKLTANIPLAELYAMFTHKAAAETVRGWRRGRNNPPAWAFEMLRSRLEKDAQEANARLLYLDRAKKEAP